MAMCTGSCIKINNLPRGFLRAAVVEMLDAQGLNGLYNFVHVPVDSDSGESLCCAVVNMVSCRVAELAMVLLSAFDGWHQKLSLEWNSHQSFDEIVEELRDSCIMHDAVPDEYKPAFFATGSRVSFPGTADAVLQPPSFVRNMGSFSHDDQDEELMIISRHTFVDVIDEGHPREDTVVFSRRRCFTDSEIIGVKFDDDLDLDLDLETCPCSGGTDVDSSCASDSDRASEVFENTSQVRAHHTPAVQPQLQVVWMPVSYTQIGRSVQNFPQSQPPSCAISNVHANRNSMMTTKRAERSARRSQRSSPRSVKLANEQVGKKRTTLTLRNIPSNLDKSAVFDMLNDQGFSGLYNFVHVPTFASGELQGHAHVNLISEHVAELASHIIGAFDGWKTMLNVCWSDYQGIEVLSKKFANDASVN